MEDIIKKINNIFDKPIDKWTENDISFYSDLNILLEKYKIKNSIVKFKLDIKDIKDKIMSRKWYINSHNKKVIEWCIDQLNIKSYSKSENKGNFKLIGKFTLVNVLFNVIYNSNKYDIKILEVGNQDISYSLSDLINIVKLFGIDKKIDIEKQQSVAEDIIKIIEEIVLYYTPENINLN